MNRTVTAAIASATCETDIHELYSLPDLGHLPRKRIHLQASIAAKRTLTLRDEKGTLVGCSKGYPLCDGQYVEMGSTVIKGIFGYPLYEKLIALHALHLFLFHSCSRFGVGCVARDKVHLLKRVVDMGWLSFNPEPALVAEEELMFAMDVAKAAWFYLPARAQIAFAQTALALFESGEVEGHRHDALRLNVRDLPMFASMDALRRLAASNPESFPLEMSWTDAVQGLTLK